MLVQFCASVIVAFAYVDRENIVDMAKTILIISESKQDNQHSDNVVYGGGLAVYGTAGLASGSALAYGLRGGEGDGGDLIGSTARGWREVPCGWAAWCSSCSTPTWTGRTSWTEGSCSQSVCSELSVLVFLVIT